MVTYEDIAKMIDHSLLQPFLSESAVKEGCLLAAAYHVASVCVRPSDVALAASLLTDSEVLVSTVIGFPHGTTTLHTKLSETQEALDRGAVELDVVLNIGKLKSADYTYVEKEIAAISEVIHARGAKIKVIFENCYLEDTEIIKACTICNRCAVDWVKTSTGFGTGGAEERHLLLMREHSLPEVRIKAAGGIRTLKRALRMRELGCTRIGASATKAILEPLKQGN